MGEVMDQEIQDNSENLDILAAVAEARIKRARICSWICMGLAILSLTFNVLLVMTMLQMGSKLTVMTQLFNTPRGTDTVFLADVLNRDLGDIDLLQKAFVHRFIEERSFILPDKMEMWRRWGPRSTLSLMSIRRIWKPVYQESDERLKALEDAVPTHADNINIISHTGKSWSGEFDLWTHGKNGVTKQRKRFSLDLGFARNRARKVSRPGYYYNPLGLVVTKYDVGSAME